MSGSLNKVQIIGNLGADPESRSFNNGGQVVNLRVACSESWKDRQSGERKEKTEWISVAIFSDGLCNVAKQYLKKGSKVYVEGKLQTRKWQDQSGNDRYTTEVVIQGFGGTLLMLDGRRDDQGSGRDSGGGYGGGGGGGQQDFGGGMSSGTRPQPAAFDTDLDDDVPFISCDERLEWRVR